MYTIGYIQGMSGARARKIAERLILTTVVANVTRMAHYIPSVCLQVRRIQKGTTEIITLGGAFIQQVTNSSACTRLHVSRLFL